MDDKVISPTEASEYKYTESEVASIDAAAIADQPSFDEAATPEGGGQKLPFKFDLKSINLKRFTRPVLIVVAILAVYIGFNFYSSKKNQDVEKKKESMQENAALIQQQQQAAMLNPVQSITSPVVSSEINVNSEQIAQVQSAMQQKIDSVAQQLVRGQDRILNMNESIAKTQQDISSVSQKMEQLTVAMQQVLSEIEKIKAPLKIAKKKVAKPPVAYHVRAIVPGRVWLESADGKSVTLRVGEQLEGYGEVTLIAPRQGMVVMSNGSIIQYGIDDF